MKYFFLFSGSALLFVLVYKFAFKSQYTNLTVTKREFTYSDIDGYTQQPVAFKNADTTAQLSDSVVDNVILKCPPPRVDEPRINFVTKNYFSNVLKSSDERAWLNAITLASYLTASEKLELLAAKLDDEQPNPAMLRLATRLCAQQPTHPACSQSLMDMSGDINLNDATNWLYIALFFAAKQDEQALIHALTQIRNAPTFSSSYADYIKRALQSFSSVKGISEFDAFSIGMSSWAATAVPFTTLYRWCDSQKQNIFNADLCIQTGSELHERAKDMIYQRLGLQLKQVTSTIAESQKNTNSESLFIETITWSPKKSEDFISSMNLLAYDDSLIPVWLNTLIFSGENLAADALIREAILKSKNDMYQPCPHKSTSEQIRQ